ncbi:MAG: SMC-Scp complex subunit ScpB [Candidatus ainarchaeum sp.]|nr:SMC-Scp complex subunit ScpB [Candidatus ainarchaeum sp.]
MENADKKRIIEAVLFISSKELSLEEIGKIIEVKNPEKAKKIVEELIKEYQNFNNSIEIVENNNKYVMRVKNQYIENIKEFSQDMEISKGALRVLSYVHMNKGEVLKSYVAKRLGSWIYPYVQELIDNGFLAAKKAGRTKKLITTEKFRKYFPNEKIESDLPTFR